MSKTFENQLSEVDVSPFNSNASHVSVHNARNIKKNYKGGRSDWFQGLLCLTITGPLFVVHSCFCQAPGSLREGGLWIKLIKLFWTKSDNNSMVVSVHAIEGKSVM